MNFKTITPEAGGIPSSAVENYLKMLDEARLSTHEIIIARGDNILFEKYYPPFTKDFLHREYSQTKSLVAIAVGFALGDGLLSLDDKIGKFFPDETKDIPDPRMAEQTVRQMLMMSTPKSGRYWFSERSDDRVRNYFETTKVAAPLGSCFQYDSTGSFILCAMVERLTGKKFIEYLREKLFDRIGVSKGIKCLDCPGGHSWGDSAALATAEDMLRICRFMLDGGKADGEQLIDPNFVSDAVSSIISNRNDGEPSSYCTQGYGYLIWKLYGEGFFFNGMGCQLSLAIPEKDIILIYNGDNQGIDTAKETIIDGFYEFIVKSAGDALPEDKKALTSLKEYSDTLKLMAARGEKYSRIEADVGDKQYILLENPMGISSMKLNFGETIELSYKNAQGDKLLRLGRCENIFGLFPEEGYSREIGSVSCPENYYRSASSAAWQDENTLLIDVQVIDEYFGRLWITLHFDGNKIFVEMKKVAEDFFTTYQGNAIGEIQ